MATEINVAALSVEVALDQFSLAKSIFEDNLVT